jgi:nuclear pore complex protein Nup85
MLSYAEYMHSDPALWQLTVAYMCSCGSIGNARADEVLTRVPLRLLNPSVNVRSSRIDENIGAGEIVGVLKAVNETCFEYQREEVRRTICKVGFDYDFDFPAFC